MGWSGLAQQPGDLVAGEHVRQRLVELELDLLPDVPVAAEVVAPLADALAGKVVLDVFYTGLDAQAVSVTVAPAAAVPVITGADLVLACAALSVVMTGVATVVSITRFKAPELLPVVESVAVMLWLPLVMLVVHWGLHLLFIIQLLIRQNESELTQCKELSWD